MMENGLQVQEKQIVNIEESAMTVSDLTGQVALIQNVMKQIMKENEHYGTIPGTNKPTLLKSGAEKLCLTFRLDPDYEIIKSDREKNFIAYTVKCSLFHIQSNVKVATGIGSCNSYESKYRYRSENTGKPVPKEYWENRDPAILGGSQFKPRKKDKQWFIFQQIENENPWDLDNTFIKMACKRALVAATLNATAASDIFTQDVEDLPPEILGTKETKPVQPKKQPKKDAPKVQRNGDATDDQINAIIKIAAKKDISETEAQEIMKWYAEGKKLSYAKAAEMITDFDSVFEKYLESQD